MKMVFLALVFVFLPAIAFAEEQNPAVMALGAEEYLGKTHAIFEFNGTIFLFKAFYDQEQSATDRIDMAWPLFSQPQLGDHPKGFFGLSAIPQTYSEIRLSYGDLAHPETPAEFYALVQYRGNQFSVKLMIPIYAENKRIYPKFEIEELRLGRPVKLGRLKIELVGSAFASRETGVQGGVGVKLTCGHLSARLVPERSAVMLQAELTGLFDK
ncbi:MAG: hypothetical protein NTZ65_02990 [Candidatus Berkelbacteria bacterium]|nr:hypothetical protein [Candidatus Berkelbacteria bacterium]